ncbi:hypothetical protein SHKM778_74620 [Streptomyces sp. KM77-8]|uniref:Uncharacterized protein n=1 Tax=Streptomyces haneummycinicus TaxID=3074435 RepID=A0AAT9HUW2_9ACTN
MGGTAVSSRVHRGGQGHRAFQRALQYGESDLEQAACALVRAASQAAGGAQTADVGDQVGREGEGDHHGHAQFVQGAGEGFE